MKKDSFPRVNYQQDQPQQLIPIPPTDDHTASRLNQTTYSDAPWIPQTSQTQPFFISQTPDLYENDRLPFDRTMVQFGQHMTTQTNLDAQVMHQSINMDKIDREMLLSVKSYTPIIPKHKIQFQYQMTHSDGPNQVQPKQEMLTSPFMSKKHSLQKSNPPNYQQASGTNTQKQVRQADIVNQNCASRLSYTEPRTRNNEPKVDQNMMRVLNVSKEDYLRMISDLSRKQVSFMARTSGAFHKDPLINILRPQQQVQIEGMSDPRQQHLFSLRQPNYLRKTEQVAVHQQSRASAYSSQNGETIDHQQSAASYSTIKRKRKMKGVSTNVTANQKAKGSIQDRASRSFY